MPQVQPQDEAGAGPLTGAARYRVMLARYPIRDPVPPPGRFARLLARAIRRWGRRAGAKGGGGTASAAPALIIVALVAL